MKYAWHQGCHILQQEWINNKCGEGTAGRGGAVFNCPSAWRISQSLTASGRKQTNIQTYFHHCCFCIFPLFIPFPLLPSHACLVFLLHFPLAFHILIHYSLSPRSHAAFWVNLRRILFVLICAHMCNFCMHCVVSICWGWLPEFKGLSPQIWFACSLFVRHVFCYVTQAHISSLAPRRQEQSETGFKSWQVLISILLLIHTQSQCRFQSNLSAVDENMLLMFI